MSAKLILLSLLVIFATSWTEENNVLILTDDDFPNVISEFPYLMIQFYAPWCGHCKKLAPIYDEVATELKNQNSPVRVAKIDCDTHSEAKSQYKVQGFPTLIFFLNGEQISYSGARTKQTLINWMTKKTRDAVVEITADKVSSFHENGKVNIVYYGDLSTQQGSIVNKLAQADDYNNYYVVKESDHAEGEVQIVRSFGEKIVTYAKADHNLKAWILLNERPLVYPFNDRTISDIFSDRKSALIIFVSGESSSVISSSFADAAYEWKVNSKKNLIFSQINQNDEHYHNLASYIKIAPASIPIVYINGGERTKYVLPGNAADITTEIIVDFLKAVDSQTSKKYKLDEEVDAVQATAEEL